MKKLTLLAISLISASSVADEAYHISQVEPVTDNAQPSVVNNVNVNVLDKSTTNNNYINKITVVNGDKGKDSNFSLVASVASTTTKLAGFEKESKTTQISGAIHYKHNLSRSFDFRVEPKVSYGKFNFDQDIPMEGTHGEEEVTGSILVGSLPIGLGYNISDSLTGFVVAGPAVGYIQGESNYCTWGCKKIDLTSTSFGVAASAGLELGQGNFVMRAAYDLVKVGDVNMSYPSLGIGYRF